MNENFTSQSSNFISAINTDVDPRTGQFMVNLPVVSLIGNNRLGPELSLSLSYSSLSRINCGFGTGFSLSLTQFNNKTNLLELSNGEKYRVSPGSDEVRNHKLKNFRFAFTNGYGDGDGYTIFWKDGKIELLEKTEDNETFVTTTICSPSGRLLYLLWDWSGQVSRLSEIRDELVTLCQISYGVFPTVTLWPKTRDESRIQFELLNESQLDCISHHISDSEIMKWYFSYELLEGMTDLLLTEVKYPTGMTDNVVYNQLEGLRYPESSGFNERLPVVLTHTRDPGAGQPETIRYFTYTEQNFLGFNGNFGDWYADSDYIYTTLTDYIYGSTETISSEGITVITERQYNNYHLQISEQTQKHSSIIREDTEYYAIPYDFIESQPAQFQLPKKKIVTLTDTSLPATEQSRQEITETEFDEHGNPISIKAPDGTLTTYEFYSAEGEENCPLEPNGFARFLKSVKITPRTSDYSDTPVNMTVYTYKSLGNTLCVVQDTESTFSGSTLLSVRTTQYQTNTEHAEYGRIIAFIDTRYEKGVSFTSRQDFDTVISDGLMEQSVIFTGHDGLQSSIARRQSIYNGLLRTEISPQGVITDYTYDVLGRILTQTLNSGTDYENTAIWEYAIKNTGPVTTMRDALGNQIRIYFDGAGRQIRQQQFDVDHTHQWFDIVSTQYDSLGQSRASTGQDWITAEPGSVSNFIISSRVSYDNWGNQSEMAFSNNLYELTQTDPVRRLTHSFSQGGEGITLMKSGSVNTQLDKITGLPVQEVMKDVSGAEQSKKCYIYDGLNRLRQEEDTDGNLTTYSYDEFNREISRTLADGTIVTREYAPHLSDSQVTCIQVTSPDDDGNLQIQTMGLRIYDSLNRVTKETVGGRVTSYYYDGASPVPAKKTLPSGESLTYTYILELDNVPRSISAEEVTQIYEYDNLTGALLKAREGDTEYVCIRSPSGQLIREQFIRQGSHHQADHISTLSGTPLSYTDITGAQTCYKRNEQGQIVEISDSALDVELSYDLLHRLSSQTVTETVGGASLTTSFAYDDFSRETTRTLTDSSGKTLTTELSWLKNGLLGRRLTQQNNMKLKDEQYNYDCRNRLVSYRVSGRLPTLDAYGNPLTSQLYQHDAINNLTSVTTTLIDGSTDTATYHYLNTDDPTQLSMVTHTHGKYPPTINLTYDANGRMTLDEAGRTLIYDVRGRLIEVSGENINGGSYQYDAVNRLATQNVSQSDVRALYYRGNDLVNEVLSKNKQDIRLIKQGSLCLGVSDGHKLTLTGTDHNNSLLLSNDNIGGEQLHSWSPYGSGNPIDLLPGFNGERSDPVSGSYHLGNGYRAYNPVLMRFNCPDSMSPFNEGGINPYAYCAGDPINLTDPSGHMSTGSKVGIGLGVAGLFAAAFTAGLSLVASTIATALTVTITTGASISTMGAISGALASASVTSLVVGGLGIVSDVTAIASGAAESSDPAASSVLGWISMGMGLAGLGISMGMGGAKILSSSNTTSSMMLSGTMKELDSMGKDIYFFEDNYKFGRRLNIVAHGSLQKNGTGLLARSFGANLDAEELFSIIKQRKILDRYENIRTIMCFSGNGNSQSFGQKLANLTKLPVKSYVGTVTGNFEVNSLNKILYEAAGIRGGDGFAYMSKTFAENYEFQIRKSNPYSLFSKNYWKWNYDAAMFRPVL